LWRDTSQHEFTPYVLEYLKLKRMAKLGFQQDYNKLSYLKTEIFMHIDTAYETVRAEEANKGKG
jgi:hypothetical protein